MDFQRLRPRAETALLSAASSACGTSLRERVSRKADFRCIYNCCAGIMASLGLCRVILAFGEPSLTAFLAAASTQPKTLLNLTIIPDAHRSI